MTRRRQFLCAAWVLLLLASASTRAQTAPATAPGQAAWISLTWTTSQGQEFTQGWSPQTGIWAMRLSTNAGGIDRVEFKDPVSGNFDAYQPYDDPGRAAKASVIRSTLTPLETAALQAARPRATMTYPDFLPQMKAYFGPDGFKVTTDSDRGMTRYVIEATDALKRESFGLDEGAAVVMVSRASMTLPATIWANSDTQRIREIRCGNREIKVSYDGLALTSVGDLGVPRDVPVFDSRPDDKTRALYDRIIARAHKPLPDGALFILKTGRAKDGTASANLEAWSAAGDHWQRRQYRLGGDTAVIPADWTDAGAETFFRNLGTAFPSETFISDGSTGFRADIDRTTHAEFHLGINPQGRSQREAGPKKYTGRDARLADSGPSTALLPFELETARYMPGCTLEAIASKERPGLEGLLWRDRSNGPDTLQTEVECWFDPQNDDRPVGVIATQFKDSFGKMVDFRRVTECGPYAKMPAPDNRSYAVHWIDTTLSPTSATEPPRSETTIRFFPGRKVPEVPKAPSGLP